MSATGAFEFLTPRRVVFGWERSKKLPLLTEGYGSRVLVVTGGSPARYGSMTGMLRAEGRSLTTFSVQGEPTVEDIEEGMRVGAGADWVLGVGGGGALDAAKAIAAMLTQEGSLMDHLEVIGKGEALAAKPLPFVALPTTAGTGAEATKNAVIKSEAHQVKVSLRHPDMLPDLALVDPSLAVTVSSGVTAATGMDALTQLLEAYVCRRANPMTDALCREGIVRAAGSLRRAVAEPDHRAAREDMALAALNSGLALANAGLGAVHGFAAPLGGRYPIAHGTVCASLLPAVWETNLGRVRNEELLERFRRTAEWMTGRTGARAEEGVEWLRCLQRDLKIPGLTQLGVVESDWPEIAKAAGRASSMKPNPVDLDQECLQGILAKAS